MISNNYFHEAKSSMAFAVDANTLDIRIKTVKDKASSVDILYGDPFMWRYDEKTKTYSWIGERQVKTSLEKHFSTATFDYWQVRLHVETKRIKYAFIIDNRNFYGVSHTYDLNTHPDQKHNLFNYFNFPYLLDVDCYQAPNWVKDTIWYSIFPDRFHTVDNHTPNLLTWNETPNPQNNQFFGGNLKGITEKLDYIHSMGFTGIYLTPIFKSPSAHKYDTVDYYEIDPTFGTKNDLKTLIEKAHKKGIKIMLDAVFNHVSYRHPFFQDVIKKGKKSLYYDAFYIKSYPFDESLYEKRLTDPGSNPPPYETFGFTPRMPKVNTEHPLMRAYLLDVATYWIEAFDIDGWRLDVSNEVSHDFWRAFRKTVKKVKPDVFILGENWDPSYPWLQGDQHDAVMNYAFMYPIWDYFSPKTAAVNLSGKDFKDTVEHVIFSYPRPVILNMFNLVDSHDTERLAYVMDNDVNRMKQVYLFQYTLPGSPSIFYGGEIGLSGGNDPNNRRCMLWDETQQNLELKAFIKQLNMVYHNEADFRSEAFAFTHVDDHALLIQKNSLYIALNKDDNPIRIPLPKGKYTNLFNDAPVVVKANYLLEPKSYIILKIQNT